MPPAVAPRACVARIPGARFAGGNRDGTLSECDEPGRADAEVSKFRSCNTFFSSCRTAARRPREPPTPANVEFPDISGFASPEASIDTPLSTSNLYRRRVAHETLTSAP